MRVSLRSIDILHTPAFGLVLQNCSSNFLARHCEHCDQPANQIKDEKFTGIYRNAILENENDMQWALRTLSCLSTVKRPSWSVSSWADNMPVGKRTSNTFCCWKNRHFTTCRSLPLNYASTPSQLYTRITHVSCWIQRVPSHFWPVGSAWGIPHHWCQSLASSFASLLPLMIKMHSRPNLHELLPATGLNKI